MEGSRFGDIAFPPEIFLRTRRYVWATLSLKNLYLNQVLHGFILGQRPGSTCIQVV